MLWGVLEPKDVCKMIRIWLVTWQKVRNTWRLKAYAKFCWGKFLMNSKRAENPAVRRLKDTTAEEENRMSSSRDASFLQTSSVEL